MANKFWVGNSGNWSDTAHWSATSGGAGGASVPTSADNVYFDVSSFTLAGQTVMVDVAANCLDMDWTGSLNSPTLAGSSTLNVYGSLTFISAMTVSYTGTLFFQATSGSMTVNTNGIQLRCFIIFASASATWTLQSDIDIGTLDNSRTLSITSGTLNTNNKNIITGAFSSSGTGIRAINLGTSTITCRISGTAWGFANVTNLTFNAGTSTIKLTGSTQTFAGGGLSYNNVEFQGTLTTITGSNTFNKLTLAAGKTVNFTAGTTQTITSLICNGTTASPSTLQSVTAGSAATIALPAGRYFIRHTSIKDITITGATSVTSIAGTNVSGNTGITFVAKFEMGRIKNDGSFNWYNTSTGTVTKISG